MVKRLAASQALFGEDLLGGHLGNDKTGALAGNFMIPPLSVLNAREGFWQDRKRAWLALGIQSELGRGETDGQAAAPEVTRAPDMAPQPQQQAPVPDRISPTPPAPRRFGGGLKIEVENSPKQPDDPEPAERATTPPAATESAVPWADEAPAVQVVTQPAPRRAATYGTAPPVIMTDKPKRAAITVEGTASPKRERIPLPDPLAKYKEELDRWDCEPMLLDSGTWGDFDEDKRSVHFLDVECYKNFFLVCLKRQADGKYLSFEYSDRVTEPDWSRLENILRTECIVTFNGDNYDIPMLFAAMSGRHDCFALKQISDEIIKDKVKPWDIEKRYNVVIPYLNHVDLEGPNPGAHQGLKTIDARLHGPLVLDLPYKESDYLTEREMNVTTIYCCRDLDKTENVFNALREPLKLRVSLGKVYGIDVRSKSDAQAGEAIVKVSLEKELGKKLYKPKFGSGSGATPMFSYKFPPFLSFKTPQMKDIVAKLQAMQFYVNGYNKVDSPAGLKDFTVTVGTGTYTMGIGGLHSTESNRAVIADDEYAVEDIDVSSQYPRIIEKLGQTLSMYPKACGPKFTPIYAAMIRERLDAKLAVKTATGAEKDKLTVKIEGFKIACNGVYGKTGNAYSFLFAPELMIHTTISGQLSLLMLIERCELAGIPVVSGNTDGITVRYPRTLKTQWDALVKAWEEETGFEIEASSYKAIYSSSVNTYFAIREDGKVKRKGPVGNPWAEKDMRGMLSKNPQMTVCSDAVVNYIKTGEPFADYIKWRSDPREFITVIKADGGAVWRGTHLGRVVRYYWSQDGEPIMYASGSRKVAKTDGARPMMELVDQLPADIDYARYIKEAEKIAVDYAVTEGGKLGV